HRAGELVREVRDVSGAEEEHDGASFHASLELTDHAAEGVRIERVASSAADRFGEKRRADRPHVLLAIPCAIDLADDHLIRLAERIGEVLEHDPKTRMLVRLEDADEATARVDAAGAVDDGPDLRRVVRVVVDNGAGARREDVEASPHGTEAPESAGDHLERNTRPRGERRGRERIANVVISGNLEADDGRLSVRPAQPEGASRVVEADVLRGPVGRARNEGEALRLRDGRERQERGVRILLVPDEQTVVGQAARELAERVLDL